MKYDEGLTLQQAIDRLKNTHEPKPTTLLDVWGTDVERVILGSGEEICLKSGRFTEQGKWFWWADYGKWFEASKLHVHYIFPPSFKEPEKKPTQAELDAAQQQYSNALRAQNSFHLSPNVVGKPLADLPPQSDSLTWFHRMLKRLW